MVLRPEQLVGRLEQMRRTALALTGSWHEAEDLVQETCARLLARPRQIREQDELGYVLTAIRNTHVNRYRADARRPRTVDVPDDFEPTAAVSTFEQVRAREVHGLLDALPAQLREAVVAVDVVGLPRTQAAAGLGISESALADRLDRARISLGARLCA